MQKNLINYIEKFAFWILMGMDPFGLNAFSEHFDKLLLTQINLFTLMFYSVKLFKKP